MPRIPQYEYQVKLRDAPDVRQSLTTNASMFGGNQANTLKSWGGAFDDMSDTFGTYANAEKKEEKAKLAAQQASAAVDQKPQSGAGEKAPETPRKPAAPEVPNAAGFDTSAGSTSFQAAQLRQPEASNAEGNSPISMPIPKGPFRGLLAPGAAKAATPDPTTATAPMAMPRPAAPTPGQQAALDAVLSREQHTPQSLLEYREAQNDLVVKVRGWRKSVASGEMTPEEARELLRDEVKGHTMAMGTMDAVRAIRGWEQRQSEQLKATDGDGADALRDRLLAASDRRAELRYQDIFESGGGLAVLAHHAPRLYRDIVKDRLAAGETEAEAHLGAEKAMPVASAFAILSMARNDPAKAFRDFEFLKSRQPLMMNSETANALETMLGSTGQAIRPSETANAIGPVLVGPTSDDEEDSQDILTGGAGNDILMGNAGDDALNENSAEGTVKPDAEDPELDTDAAFFVLEPDDNASDSGSEADPESDLRSFLDEIERGAFDGDAPLSLSDDERAFVDAYRKAFAERSQGGGPDTADPATVEKWRAAALEEASNAAFGTQGPDARLPSAGSVFLQDYENEMLAARQRTSPHVVDGKGNYVYARAPESEQALLHETGRISDPEKYVVLYDPNTREPTVWHRDPDRAENRLTSLGRLLGIGILGGGRKGFTTGMNLARQAARSTAPTANLAKVSRLLGANRRFGEWVDEVKIAQAAHAAGKSFAKPVQAFKSVGYIDVKVRDFLKSQGVELKTHAITITRQALTHVTRDSKTAATTAEGLSKAVPAGMVKRMPEILSRPSAVLWDKGKENLLYVFNVARDPRQGKFVVEVNYSFGYRPGGTGKNVTRTINNVVSAGMVATDNLEDASKYHKIR